METKPPSRQPVLLWLVISQLLVLASIFPLMYMLGALFTLVAGTQPADPWSYILTAAPFLGVGLLLSVASWFAYGRGQYRRAAVLASFSFAVPFGILILIWVGLWGLGR